jgi:putative flippase GtrA
MRRDAPASHSMRDYAWGYTLVGGLAAGVDVGGFHWLAPRLEPLLLAAVLSFVLAAMVNYTLSSLWVYRRPWRSLRRATLFLGLACVGLAVNAGVTWWLASTWPVHATLAKVGGVATAFGINFWMNTRLVFARAAPSQASP